MATRELTDFLNNSNVSYHCYNHEPAITASEVAQAAHIPGRHMAKTVIVNVDGELTMAVLPSNHYLDPEKLRLALDANRVDLAREEKFKDRFPLCEVGSEPPFGNLYDMHVYIDDTLLTEDWLAFNAGSHTEVIKMGMGDFLRLSRARACAFAMLH